MKKGEQKNQLKSFTENQLNNLNRQAVHLFIVQIVDKCTYSFAHVVPKHMQFA